jgi:uncharacterized membrane protein HdeD (DUF308 family)
MLFMQMGTPSNQPRGNQWGAGLLFNGILCVAFGLAVLAAPELLAYLVAVFLIILGSTLIAAGWKLRQATKR